MGSRVDDVIENTFRWKENEGESKVTSLKEAIRRNVKPGMKLHTCRSRFNFEAAGMVVFFFLIPAVWQGQTNHSSTFSNPVCWV